MKLLLAIILFNITLFATTIQKPTDQYIADGAVIDMIIDEDKLYAATSASCIDIFDIKSKKIIEKISVTKIKDFMGDEIDSKIYSVDKLKDEILVLSLGKGGARRIHIYKNKKLNLVIPTSKHLYIAKAKFLDKDNVILGLLSNDIVSYNIRTKKENWSVQASLSKFSDFVLTEKKDKVIVADESGDLQIINTRDGKHLKTLSGENLDNVFRVDTKNGIIATAGQDRRVVVYDANSAYYKISSFMIYAVGLSPSGKIVGYASNENNDVTLFKTNTKSTIGVFGGNKITLTNILFKNENEFFVSSDEKTINYYKIK